MSARQDFARDHGLTYTAEGTLGAPDPGSAYPNLMRAIISGVLPGGIEGLVADKTIKVKPEGEGQPTERVITTALTRVPESAGYIPALTARDATKRRGITDRLVGAGGLIPIFDHIEFESEKLNATYRVGTVKGQDQVWLRQLFSPTFVDYLAEQAPDGCYFDLYGGVLSVASDKHIDDAAGLESFCSFVAHIADRIRSESKESTAVDGGFDLPISEMREKADRLRDEQVGKVQFSEPPKSVAEAAKPYRPLARRSRLAWLLSFGIAAFIALLAAGFIGLLVAGITETESTGSNDDVRNGAIAFFIVGTPLFLWIFIKMVRAQISSQSTVWGLEAFLRGYAKNRGLALGDIDRFQLQHNLLTPAPPTRLLEGRLPAVDLEGNLLVYSSGTEGGLGVAIDLEDRNAPTIHLAPRGTTGDVTVLGGFFIGASKGTEEPKKVAERRERIRSRVGEQLWERYTVLADADIEPEAVGRILTEDVREGLDPKGGKDNFGLVIEGGDVLVYGQQGPVADWSATTVDEFCARAGRVAAAVNAAAGK